MSHDTDPDSDDIDALLRDDAVRHGISDPGLGSVSDATVSQPAQQTHVQRLLARSAHISSDLRQAFTNIRDTQLMVDIDRESCGQLVAELNNWEQVLVELDKACNRALMTKDEARSSNPAAQKELPEQSDSNDLLIAKIAAQEARIQELESRLKGGKLSAGKNLTQSDVDRSAGKAPTRTVNRLIIAMTDQGNLKFPLYKQIITIGRSPQNDIHIRSRFISRFHARIVCDQDEAIIEDLDSSNGIAVNSCRTRRQTLRSGDSIDLGRTQLKYIDLSEGSSGEGQA